VKDICNRVNYHAKSKNIYFSVFQIAKTSENFKLYIFSYIYFKLYYISPEKVYHTTAVFNTYTMPVIPIRVNRHGPVSQRYTMYSKLVARHYRLVIQYKKEYFNK